MPIQSRRSPRGFTLVEILLVVAVIAILSALMLPVFSGVRERARRTVCTSNMKQLALGFQQYAADFERLPSATDGPPGENLAGGWTFYSKFGVGVGRPNDALFDVTKGSIYPYVKNTKVFLCPTDIIAKGTGLSYAANACASQQKRKLSTADSTIPGNVGVRVVTGYSKGKKLTSIKNPTQFMLMTEEARPGSGDASTDDPNDTTDDGYYNSVRKAPSSGADDPSFENKLAMRHHTGGNVAFVDGHVKWYKREMIIDQKLQIGGEGDLNKGCPEFQGI